MSFPTGILAKLMITLAALAAVSAIASGSPDTAAQHAKRMAWWTDARFGMFIHWGLYAVPAGNWGDKRNYGEWIREEAHIPVKEYEKFEGQFNPTKFDANLWAKMAKDAGMKYVVITTKHHDGFNLFKSKYSDWSIAHTPFNRDVMKELSTAVRKQGLTMGWYHSIMDWHHPDYLPRRSWEGADRPADGADMDRYIQYLHNEVSQLLTDYGPIGVMWFDGEWENTWTPRYGKDLYDLCRKLQPNVIVNNRVSPGRDGIEDASLKAGDYGTPEQFIPPTGLPGQDWETCMTMNGHWGYNAYDTDWKSSRTLIRNLVDIASKGGNYLLNVGPRADGTFPSEAVARLHDIGKWMKVNGESIYGTKASAFDNLTWGRSTTKRRGNRTTLYLQVFNWPKNGLLTVPGIANRPVGARILGRGRTGVKRVGADLAISLPTTAPDANATVVALTIEGDPVIYKAPIIAAPTQLVVNPVMATITVPTGIEVRYTLDGSVPDGKSPRYSGPVSIGKAATLRAASFVGAKRVSGVTESRFVTARAMAAVSPGETPSTLKRETFSGTWNQVPNFDRLTASETDFVSAIVPPMSSEQPIEKTGFRYSGFITVPEDSVYLFNLSSDDGSKLWIDGRLVVDNDGLHGATTKSGSVPLAKGAHRIRLDYFNATGGAALTLTWGKPGEKAHEISPEEISH